MFRRFQTFDFLWLYASYCSPWWNNFINKYICSFHHASGCRKKDMWLYFGFVSKQFNIILVVPAMAGTKFYKNVVYRIPLNTYGAGRIRVKMRLALGCFSKLVGLQTPIKIKIAISCIVQQPRQRNIFVRTMKLGRKRRSPYSIFVSIFVQFNSGHSEAKCRPGPTIKVKHKPANGSPSHHFRHV